MASPSAPPLISEIPMPPSPPRPADMPEPIPPPQLTLSPEDLPNVDALITEDGAPVDGIYSERLMRLLPSCLYASWVRPDGRPFVALANVGLYITDFELPIVPDFLISDKVQLPADLFAKGNRCYFVWRYGKAPDLALEIVSNNEGGELDHKLLTYARMGVPFYVVWDPAEILGEQKLSCFVLQGGIYAPLPEPWFPLLGLGLKVWHGVWEGAEQDWLRWCDRAGNLLPLPMELVEQERQRAETERLRAETERQRADRLAAQLRAAGLTPET